MYDEDIHVAKVGPFTSVVRNVVWTVEQFSSETMYPTKHFFFRIDRTA